MTTNENIIARFPCPPNYREIITGEAITAIIRDRTIPRPKLVNFVRWATEYGPNQIEVKDCESGLETIENAIWFVVPTNC